MEKIITIVENKIRSIYQEKDLSFFENFDRLYFNDCVSLEPELIDYITAINFNHKSLKLITVVKNVYKNTFLLDDIAQKIKDKKFGITRMNS